MQIFLISLTIQKKKKKNTKQNIKKTYKKQEIVKCIQNVRRMRNLFEYLYTHTDKPNHTHTHTHTLSHTHAFHLNSRANDFLANAGITATKTFHGQQISLSLTRNYLAQSNTKLHLDLI